MIKLILFLSLLAIITQGCSKEPNTLTTGEGSSEGISLIDTIKITTTTVLLDSLPTSGTGHVLIGRMDDPQFGAIQASSYFHIGSPGSLPVLSKNAVYDSLIIKMDYNKYYYGDTTKTASISVYQLSKKLELEENKNYNDPGQQSLLLRSSALYNTSSVNHNNQLLGNIKFTPRPNSRDSIAIKLDNVLGNTLFNLVKDDDIRLKSDADFLDYFKGIALIPDAYGSNAVIGFSTTATAMQLYYSEPDNNGHKESRMINFNMVDSTLQFNKIQADRSATTLKSLTATQTILPGSATKDQGFVQGGIGIVTKIQFPGITEMIKSKKIIINKAELIIQVPKNTSPFDIPKEMVLFTGNKQNKPTSVLTTYNSTSDQVATLQKDAEATGNLWYSFIITQYLDQLSKTTDPDDLSLLLSLPLTNLTNSLNRVVTGAPGTTKTQIKLNILYTSF